MINLAVNWLPDETFFSICSRQHAFFANVDSGTTTSWLFGHHRRYAHDFNYNLDALAAFMIHAWGEPTTIINEHTIVPFFFPFQSPRNVLAAQESLRGPKLGSIKYRLGLLTGRFGAEHPLKACTACMDSDRLTEGVAYWHLSHQYPSMILCPVHGQHLRESIENRQWSGCFEWLLPVEGKLRPPPLSATSAADQVILNKMAAAIMDLATFGSRRLFEPGAVCAVYRAALANYGPGRSGLDSAACSLAAYTTRLQAYPPFDCLPSDCAGSATFLGSLIRQPRGRCHPLKHLTLITWLFNSLNEFVCLHDQMTGQCLQSDKTSVSAPKVIADRRRVLACTGQPPIVRRPKVLKQEIRSTILARLSKGVSKKIICSDFHITISTVNKLMRSQPFVHEAWLTNARSQERFERRLLLEQTTHNHSKESAKQIRLRIPAVYAWLYRNDRRWLNNKLSELPTGRIGNHSAVDWTSRDFQLEVDLAATARILSATHELPFTRGLIFATIPKLATALEKRNAFRRTRSLLSALTNSTLETHNRSDESELQLLHRSNSAGVDEP